MASNLYNEHISLTPFKLYFLEDEKWHELELDVVVIQPYQPFNQSGDWQWATVHVEMSNCDGASAEYFGLRVQHVEMIPFSGNTLSRGKH